MNSEPLWSPFHPSHLADPHAMYQRLRSEDPIHRAQTGEYIITRYADVKHILKSTDYRSGNRIEWYSRGIEYFKNKDEDLGNIYKALNTFILFLNPPDHLPIRNLVTKVWDNREVDLLVQSTADELLRKLSGTFDVVKDYAQPLPAIVVSKIMGTPIEDYEHLRSLGVKMVRSLDLYHSWKELVELNEACGTFVRYFSKLVDVKRNKPDESIFSKLIAANDREKHLSDEQMISLLIFLFIAGEETTTNSISNSLRNLISRPSAYQQLRSNPASLGGLPLEELFRFDGPIHLLGRVTKNDTTIGNMLVPANSAITLVLASANRDESQFVNASELILDRSPNQHLAFGYGTHFCLGEWLGKLQTRIAIDRFMAKFAKANAEPQHIEWYKNLSVRGLKSLIINTEE